MCRRGKHRLHFTTALEQTKTIQESHRKIIHERYVPILEEFESRANFYAGLFHTCRFIVTVGSLIVPALLSIQYVDAGSTFSEMDSQTFTFQIYWTTWVVSLLVTTSNGIFTLFKVDKRYFLLHTMLEQLRSEGWQYLQLSGRFSGFYTPKDVPTHENQFLYFCHAIEKLKMKQVEEEYYKSTESNLHGSTTTHANGAGNSQYKEIDLESGKPMSKAAPAFFQDGLIPPTPLNPQLHQLLQALSVDGGSSSISGIRASKALIPEKQIQETTTEMPVQSEMQGATAPKERILRETSEVLPKTESIIRMGAEIPTQSLEQKSKPQENS